MCVGCTLLLSFTDIMFIFAPFQCWLQLVVFHLKQDFLSNFVLILIILNLSLWMLYYTVKRFKCSFLNNFRLLIHMLLTKIYEFVIWKWLKCTENWTGSPLLHLLPPDDLALWKVANIINIWRGGGHSICIVVLPMLRPQGYGFWHFS